MFASLIAAGACSDDSAQGNLPPIVTSQDVATDEDVSIDIRVLDGARDPEGDLLRVTSVYAGVHTIEVIDHAILRFSPAPNFNGTASVNCQVSDGRHLPVTEHVTITVRPGQ